mgnify:CR=1 FL=1
MGGIKDAKKKRKRRRRLRKARLIFCALLFLFLAAGLVLGIRAAAPKVSGYIINLAKELQSSAREEKNPQDKSDETKKPDVEVKALVINTDEPVFSGEPVTVHWELMSLLPVPPA